MATQLLPVLVTAFGPAGAVAFMLTLVIGFFYRRDLMLRVNGLKEAHERRDAREERFIIAIERLAGSIGQQSKDLENHHEQEMDSLRRIEENSKQSAHGVNNLLGRVAPSVPAPRGIVP